MIDILTGRSEEDKAETAKNLKSLVHEEVAYLYHSRMPYYDDSALVEYYKGGINAYTIDISTGQVVEVIPLSIEENQQSILSDEELEKKAKDYISSINNIADIATLTLSIGKKGNNIFFRWEDLSKKLSGGMNPFIQIGYSSTGTFLNLVNTLPFAKNTAITMSSTDILSIDQFNEIYANGGSYWSATGPSMNTMNNAGYCYIAGWCNPKNFYYKSGVSSYPSSGMWIPNSNSDVQASAFIPSTHATGDATYYVYITGYDPDSWDINQYDYYNTWVSITQEGSLPDINEIKMMNYGDSGYEFAWDETWVYDS